jgi:acyl-CoA synthetase (AMP-forming)/AMP-acid ligase II
MGITQSVKRAVQQNPNGYATIFGTRTRRWTEFAERVGRLAGGLHSLGIGSGDRIAILSFNSDRYFEIFAAVPWAGAVLVPLNIRWSPAEDVYAINDSGAKVLLVDDAFAAMLGAIREKIPSVQAVIHMGEDATPLGMTSYEQFVESSSFLQDAGRTAEDLAGIFYTGGTTGLPKGVMLSHRSLWASTTGGMSVFPTLTGDFNFLVAVPMFHIAGVCCAMFAFTLSATSVILPAFSAERVLATIAEYRVRAVCLVPTMIRMLLTLPSLSATDLSSLRLMLYGASPMPEQTLRRAIRVLPDCRFIQYYGQTEVSPNATALSPDYHVLEGPNAGKLESAGRALSCCEVEVVNAQGIEMPRGTVGEIRIRGFNTMLGYWNKPEETAATLRDGWVYTGDAGRMDEEGFLYVVDRIKDMIVSGGENVYSIEVESACLQHPAVSQCVVIGVPHSTWGEAVHAIIILKEGEQVVAEDLIAHCHRLIAGYKCPRSIEFRSEPFPLSGAGKVLKRQLRAPYWEGRQRQVN